ncbi:ankyrin repeat domain-containing protein 11 isoform X2 [Neocloeon triangulifer]|uniref:ankyrin repeat domain-containing protein 11 isoform X2 n=1 Tax=Neocloeon triangulifer TaxID=2078957 RepID=UPI00286F1FF7|nr:ankyrin repeat domain-containing protein 11 isoform X2 [Neocloeon triangulifer]
MNIHRGSSHRVSLCSFYTTSLVVFTVIVQHLQIWLQSGWTPLHEACNHGHFEIAEWLIRAAADVNARGLDDETPLHDATRNGHAKLVELLLQHGADQHLKNSRGVTPSDIAGPQVADLFAKYGSSQQQAPAEKTPTEGATAVSEETSENVLSPEGSISTAGPEAEEAATTSVATRHQPTSRRATYNQTVPRSAGGAACEMRRTPSSQNKVDKSGSPRVTLRLHQVKNRDDKRSLQAKDAANYETRLQFSIMDQKAEDIYEFKSGKDGSPNSPSEADSKIKDSENISANAPQPTSPKKDENEKEATKRGASELDLNDDDESKRKRRKEEKAEVKGPGRSTGRAVDKSVKPAAAKGAAASKVSNTASTAPGERKSPSNSAGNSPKASSKGDSESDGDDGKRDPGPKVPPLKIVIPQQSSSEQEQGTRNGKNGNGRHQALPYVVTSSSNDSEGAASDKVEVQPVGTLAIKDEKKDAATLQEERSQRVLRSSHRSSNSHTGQSSSSALDSMANSPSPSKSDDKSEAGPSTDVVSVEVHPRKRKIKASKESSVESVPEPSNSHSDPNPTETAPATNCYEMFLNIRRQIDRRRKGLFPVQPKPPQGFKDYLMNKCTYVLAGKATTRVRMQPPPQTLPPPMKDLFVEQEKARYRLCLQHVIEKEKLVLSVEQEILRVHGRAARALANQSLPFSVCTILKDEEVYNVITPEQEEKDRNARSRYNGRLFLSWLQDVDDKWEKIKENMLLRHHKEADALQAIQKMDWEWKLKEHSLCELKSQPVIDNTHVPLVHVSDDFDLLPA